MKPADRVRLSNRRRRVLQALYDVRLYIPILQARAVKSLRDLVEHAAEHQRVGEGWVEEAVADIAALVLETAKEEIRRGKMPVKAE